MYSISDAKDTLFWHDIWCDLFSLWNNVEAKQVFNLPKDATIANKISNGEWSQIIQELDEGKIKANIQKVSINSKLSRDICRSSNNGKFATKVAYDDISPIAFRVPWSCLVWRKNQPYETQFYVLAVVGWLSSYMGQSRSKGHYSWIKVHFMW